jgi:hypothetical protein
LLLLVNDRTGRWSTVPALVRPEQIVEALLRAAGERPPVVAGEACLPLPLRASLER